MGRPRMSGDARPMNRRYVIAVAGWLCSRSHGRRPFPLRPVVVASPETPLRRFGPEHGLSRSSTTLPWIVRAMSGLRPATDWRANDGTRFRFGGASSAWTVRCRQRSGRVGAGRGRSCVGRLVGPSRCDGPTRRGSCHTFRGQAAACGRADYGYSAAVGGGCGFTTTLA